MLAAAHLLLLAQAQAQAPMATAACPAKLLEHSCFHCSGVGADCKGLRGQLNTSSVDECCAACAQHADCDIWTRQPTTGTSNCFLKSLLPGVPHPNPTACKATSGVMPPPHPPPPPPPPPAPTPLPAGTSPRDFKNVLFIAVDDLRPEIAAYGHSYMHTPHIDAFAKQSTVFTRAYVQYAFCGPSRNSFMTGRRPDSTQAWSFMDHFREEGVGDRWISMPEWFRLNGFYTSGAGKLFHPGLPPNFDGAHSWQKFVSPGSGSGLNNRGEPVCDTAAMPWIQCPPTNGCLAAAKVAGDGHWCALDRSKLTLPLEDDSVLAYGQEMLRVNAANLTDRPFFLAVGFHKPHLPFYFPSEFGDLYPPADEIAPPEHPYPPKGMPLAAWHEGGFDNKWGRPCVDTGPNSTRVFRRAYYSAVSFTDDNIGKLLSTLDVELRLGNDTVVALMGDHGWQLGEMNEWRKMTNFELGVRVPLVIRTPWLPKSIGKFTPALAEAVDLFPTFVDLSKLGTAAKLPSDQILQGFSLQPILVDPPPTGTGIRPYAFSQFAKSLTFSSELGKMVPWDECDKCDKTTNVTDPEASDKRYAHAIDYMGYSLREDRWRFTEWVLWDTKTLRPLWNSSAPYNGVELYDHGGDFGASMDAATATVNLAADPQYAKVVAKLRAALRAQFRGDHEPPQEAASGRG